MDSERVFLQLAERYNLVGAAVGDVNDVFQHIAEDGCRTAVDFVDKLPSHRLLDSFIKSSFGYDALQSKVAVGLRKLHAKCTRLAKKARQFEKLPAPIITRTCTQEADAAVGRHEGRGRGEKWMSNMWASPAVPVDRRGLRAQLVRRRSESISISSQKTVAPSGPALSWHFRRGVKLLLMRAHTMKEGRENALPCHKIEDMAWLRSSLGMQGSSSADPTCAEVVLVGLEAELLMLRKDVTAASSHSKASMQHFRDRLAAAKKELSLHKSTILARVADKLRCRVQSIYAEIDCRLGVSGEIEAASQQDVHTNTSEKSERVAETLVANLVSAPAEDLKRRADQLELSREQQLAVEFPTSIFLQGRSGTGKTLVLVRRLIHRQAVTTGPQVFITRSSLLLGEVATELTRAGCQLSKPGQWPPKGLACVTWEQLVRLLVKNMPRGATIDYTRFQSHYWPRMRAQAHHLPPLLVWAEFNTRLRSFATPSASAVMDKQEYMKEDLAAIGIRLNAADMNTIYTMFVQYSKMKRSTGELDDADVAMLAYASAPRAVLSELYVDEAQDFSPTELSVLLSLCYDPDGVTMAGDTCQTINPGSAFSFCDIVNAFCQHGGGLLSDDHREAFKLHAQQCQVLHLKCNYRCAAGVAALASSVAELLLERFPRSADWIEEVSVQGSSKLPVFVELPGSFPGSCIMGQGPLRVAFIDPARVAILVRTDEARQKLRTSGVKGTILTPPEAKGLEFDFVILCGLLTDCHDSMIWSLADEGSMDTGAASYAASVQELLCKGEKIAALSPQEHRRLCRIVLAIPEFKTLYVAITRARLGCSLLECKHDPGVWAPLLQRWQRSGLVESWLGERSYVLEATPEQRKRHQSPLDYSAGASASKSSPSLNEKCTSAEMLHWLDAELSSRQGRMQKRARAELMRERTRLRRGGDADATFPNKFEESFGLRQTSIATMVEECNDDLPSLAQAVMQRFDAEIPLGAPEVCEASSIHVLGLRRSWPPNPKKDLGGAQIGFKMLTHAADAARDRWQVFAEARRALLQGVAALDAMIAESFQHEDQKETDFNRVVGVIFQEALRSPSWRGGSNLGRLKKLVLWEQIFSFIVPESVSDLHNLVALVAERVQEHAALKGELLRGVVLAKAWHLVSSARHDVNARAREDLFECKARAKLREQSGRLRSCKASKVALRSTPSHKASANLPESEYVETQALSEPFAEASQELQQLNLLMSSKAAVCAEAGGAFLSLGKLRQAAEAWAEAGAALGYVPHIAKDLHEDLLQRGPLASNMAATEERMQQCSFQSAACWLIEGWKFRFIGMEGAHALRSASVQFANAGLACEAAWCLAYTGDLRAALHCLNGMRGTRVQSLTLLCAAMLSDMGIVG